MLVHVHFPFRQHTSNFFGKACKVNESSAAIEQPSEWHDPDIFHGKEICDTSILYLALHIILDGWLT